MMSGPATSLHRSNRLSIGPVYYKQTCKDDIAIPERLADGDMVGSSRHGAWVQSAEGTQGGT